MNGKPAIAPCGHPGEHVVGQYIRCLTKGCDGLPPEPDEFGFELVEEATKDLCPDFLCRSSDVEAFSAPFTPFTMHCNACGKCW